MPYIREQINSTSPQDIMKMNDNFMSIFEKVFGDINYSDIDKNLKDKVNTQWIPVQYEGNLDKDNPSYIRFFIPPNVTTIKSSSFNMITEQFRMDSSVTQGGGQQVEAPIVLSIGDVIGGATTSTPSVSMSSNNSPYTADNLPYYLNFKIDNNYGGLHMFKEGDWDDKPLSPDLAIKITNHNHDITHTHEVSVSPHSHTGSANVSVPDHTHSLKAGIYVATDTPADVKVYLNDFYVTNITQQTMACQDLSENIKIGEWNTIKVTTSNIARVVLYGTVEVIIK